MKSGIENVDILNRIIYDNLVQILKRLNKRIHLKLFALGFQNGQEPVFKDNDKRIEIIRIKKTVSNREGIPDISQDRLQTISNLFSELRISYEQEGVRYEEFKSFINQDWFDDNKNNTKAELSLPNIEGGQPLNEEIHNENRILYVNQLTFSSDLSTNSIVYILELRNIEHEPRRIFYMQPEVSFLRMILDYYFVDFFTLNNGAFRINDNDTIMGKYNEDGLLFNRRMARLFFGKMQNLIHDLNAYSSIRGKYEFELNNEYYVNSLLEKIEDIAALTYENANPFGSILFMNKEVITKGLLIRFTVEFLEKDRIGLEDAKRIRKLLEITNSDNDLYLIADEKEIYGLGEVKWNELNDELALRLDFSGLSKYNLVLVQTKTDQLSRGELVIESGKKFYRSNLNLIEMQLISVASKNPRLGEEGYNPEKFKQLLINTFWEDESQDRIQEKVDRFDQIVRKAREQKHGTMVVITDKSTAERELEQLNKTSTLIKPILINPEYVKYLTSIDGAIYFDKDGLCYAIGVILDGIADKDIGDASRGARFNSAYRYINKLKKDEQTEDEKNTDGQNEDKQSKCIIVIISEDGMVDLIPESEHEDMLLSLTEEIIDMIGAGQYDTINLKQKEAQLLGSKIADFDLLFNIGEIYRGNERYKDAITFFENGITKANHNYILPKYNNILGVCYYRVKDYSKAIKYFELAIKSIDNNGSKKVYMHNIGEAYFGRSIELKKNSEKNENEINLAIKWLSEVIELSGVKAEGRTYNLRGKCYIELELLAKKKKSNDEILFKYAIEDFSQAILLNPRNSIYYWNRYFVYSKINRNKECIEDLIHAEAFNHEDEYIEKLSDFLENNSDLIEEAVKFYNNLSSQEKMPSQLDELISKYQAILEINRRSEVAVGKASAGEKED